MDFNQKQLSWFLVLITTVIIMAQVKAETIMVQSIKGHIFIQTQNGGMTELKTRQKIDSEDMVKVEENSTVIFKTSDGTTITISKQGVVKPQEIIRSMRAIKKIQSKLSKLGKSDGSDNSGGPTAVAGVRGNDVSQMNRVELKRDLFWEY